MVRLLATFLLVVLGFPSLTADAQSLRGVSAFENKLVDSPHTDRELQETLPRGTLVTIQLCVAYDPDYYSDFGLYQGLSTNQLLALGTRVNGAAEPTLSCSTNIHGFPAHPGTCELRKTGGSIHTACYQFPRALVGGHYTLLYRLGGIHVTNYNGQTLLRDVSGHPGDSFATGTFQV